ncbi:MAG: cytochrome c [Chloroflexi bacterium]|nr:cytochrome c [Chloroflexota bacterium]
MATDSATEHSLAFRRRAVIAGAVGVAVIFFIWLVLAGVNGKEVMGAIAPAMLLPQTSPLASDGQSIFEQKCLACHTIGGGRTVGPDLKDVLSRRDRGWLTRFIVAPDKLISQGDTLANQLVQEYGMAMPNMGVSESEAAAILAYIESLSEDKPTASLQTEVTKVETSVTLAAGDADRGRDIFTGKIPLANGGAACIACHNINGIATLGGGVVARDLTGIASTMGQTGVVSILKTTPFPIMKEIYSQRPLAEDEIADLVAFISTNQSQVTPTSPIIFILISASGVLIIAGMFQFFWRGRLAGVRRSLVKGGSS